MLASGEEKKPYECDGLSAYRQLPGLVALPETIEQVRHVLRACREHGVPVVTRGAGTGLSGGALPHADGVLLSLSKLSRILEIDPINRTARVEPGVRNLAISEAAAPHGLYYAPDPSSQIACSIGGNVAENAGGVHCLKYGLTVHNVLGLKFLTADGELITLGGSALDIPGYDLLALLTGSEGMLGVIVEITVKLLPKPERAQVMLAAFDDIEKAGDAVAAIIASGCIPGGLEMMDNPAIRAAEDYVHADYPVDAAAILLCELDGTHEEVSEGIARVRELLLKQGRHRSTHRQGRSRTPADVGRTQGGVPRGRATGAGLLLHGRHCPAQAYRDRVEAYRRTLQGVRSAGSQCISRRRWQPAPADSLRCQQAGRPGAHRDIGRQDS